MNINITNNAVVEALVSQISILSISIGNGSKYLALLPFTNINRDGIWVPRKGVNSQSLVPVQKDLTLI